MIVYLDESYPDDQSILILGCLFLENKAHNRLRNKIREIKRNYNFPGEFKYNKILNKKTLSVAKKAVKVFLKEKNASFIACVVPYSHTKLQNIKGKNKSEKRTRIYVDSAENILLGYIKDSDDTQVFFDKEERISKTKLHARLLNLQTVGKNKIKSVTFVDSKDETKCPIQICDLLTGCVKQNLFPSQSLKGKFKREFSKYTLNSLNISNCSSKFWNKNKKSINHKKYVKFYISYFDLPRYTLKEIYENQKNRS